jgi:uncharacterized protein
MITAVLDTNVLVAGFVRRTTASPPAQIIDAWRAGAYTLVTSEHIIGELTRTLAEPYFRQRIAAQQADRLVDLLRRRANPTTAVVVHGVATHQEDDLVLATAVAAQANYLVTGDKRLRDIGSYEGVQILSPREFLDILQR